MARGTIIPRPSTDGKRISYRVRWETRGAEDKRKHHSQTVRTKHEADALLAEKQQALNSGNHFEPSKETLGAYLERWLTASAPSWSEATFNRYEIIIRVRIVPEIGTVPLARLDAMMVQTFYAELVKRYAPATVRMTHSVLDAALARAVAWRLILHNPTDGAILPSTPRPTAVVWTEDECAAFLAAEHERRKATLWQLALDTGMRIGELLGLAWRDVSLDRDQPACRTLTIDRNGRHMLGEVPKTKSSRRSIVIGEDSVAALRTYRVEQAKRRLRLGAAWHDLDLVFDRGDGRIVGPYVANNALNLALERSPELPPITLHGMHHTMATLALGLGVNPKVVQERLGHANISITLDRYSHVTPAMQEEAANLINSSLRGKARPKRGQSAS